MAISIADFKHVQDVRLRKLLSFWLDHRGAGIVPPAECIDPLEIPYALGIVWLCDVENDPRDYRYRLVGEHIRVTSAGPMVGRTLRELTDAASIDRVIGYFNQAVDVPAIVHVSGRIYAEVDSPASGERVLMPFRGAGEDVTRILGATVHNWVERGVQFMDPPKQQMRTFTPADGRSSWRENWL